MTVTLKTTIKRLLPLLPSSAQRFLRSRAESLRRRERIARKERSHIAVTDVLARLEKCGLDGDIMIHGSISNIGKFDRPVSEFVKAWFQQFDLKRQTVMVPALPYNTTMREYLDGCTGFDVRSAKNAMGAVSNVVMAMPGAMRSVHPTHSVVAIGADSDYYVAGHESDGTPFGPNSPYRKLTERGGKIVMFGVGLNSVTCFHVYEDMLGPHMPLAVYLDKPFSVSCIGANGNAIQVTTTCHNPGVSAIRECERARDALVGAGAMTSQALGDSELSIIDAKLFTKTLLMMLDQGRSIYGPVKITPTQRLTIRGLIESMT